MYFINNTFMILYLQNVTVQTNDLIFDQTMIDLMTHAHAINHNSAM